MSHLFCSSAITLARVSFLVLVLTVFLPYLCSVTPSFSNQTQTVWPARTPVGTYKTPFSHYIYNRKNYSTQTIQMDGIQGYNQRRIESLARVSVEGLTPPPPSFSQQQQLTTSVSSQPNHEANAEGHQYLKPPQQSSSNPYLYIPSPHYGGNKLQSMPKYHKKPTYHSEYEPQSEEHEKEKPEIEDKVFSKTIVATKALKIGKIIFSFFLVLIVIVLAILSSLGANLTPIALPLALFPVGFIALALFIPLLFLFVPLVVSGLAGEKKRRRRFIDEDHNEILQSLESRVGRVLDHWPYFLLSLGIQKYRNFSRN